MTDDTGDEPIRGDASLPSPRKQKAKATPKPQVNPRALTVSKKLQTALRCMADGRTRKQAAEDAGMTDHGLYAALKKPHVKAAKKEIERELRDSLGFRALARGAQLMDEATSEHVRMRATEWVGGVAGEVPVSRHDVRISGMIEHQGYSYPKPDNDAGTSGVIDHAGADDLTPEGG